MIWLPPQVGIASWTNTKILFNITSLFFENKNQSKIIWEAVVQNTSSPLWKSLLSLRDDLSCVCGGHLQVETLVQRWTTAEGNFTANAYEFLRHKTDVVLWQRWSGNNGPYHDMHSSFGLLFWGNWRPKTGFPSYNLIPYVFFAHKCLNLMPTFFLHATGPLSYGLRSGLGSISTGGYRCQPSPVLLEDYHREGPCL